MKKLFSVFLIIVINYHYTNSQNITNNLNLWNDGKVKTTILKFVNSVTTEGNPNFLPRDKRIAVFDMDGTILLEKPIPMVINFAVNKMLKQIDENPKLKNKQPYKAVYENDLDFFSKVNLSDRDSGFLSLMLYATDNYSVEQYLNEAYEFMKTKDERFNLPYNKLLYSPILELIDLLKSKDFDVYVVSGSDNEFIRSVFRDKNIISDDRTIGTTILTEFTQTDTGYIFIRKHDFIEPINLYDGKPINILNKIGGIPIIAVGNSTGDKHMLEYSKNAPYSLQLIVNHDDSEREYEYDSQKISELCSKKGWIEISMKRDFKEIFEN